MYIPSATSASIPCPYAGRVFELVVSVDEGYPYASHKRVQLRPDASGRIPLYHPAVSTATGEWCTGLWAAPAWRDTWWLSTFGEHLRSHLSQPQEGGLNVEALTELQGGDLAAFEAKAREACKGARVEASAGAASSGGGAAGGGQ